MKFNFLNGLKKKKKNNLILISLGFLILLPSLLLVGNDYSRIIESINEREPNRELELWAFLHMILVSFSILVFIIIFTLHKRGKRLIKGEIEYKLDRSIYPGLVYWFMNDDYQSHAFLADLFFHENSHLVKAYSRNKHLKNYQNEVNNYVNFDKKKFEILNQKNDYYKNSSKMMNLLSFGLVFISNIPYLSVKFSSWDESPIGEIGIFILYIMANVLFFATSHLLLIIVNFFRLKGFNSTKAIPTNPWWSVLILLIIYLGFNFILLLQLTASTGFYNVNVFFFCLLSIFFAYTSTKDFYFINQKGKKLKKDISNIYAYLMQSPKDSSGRLQLYPHLIPYAIVFELKGYDLKKEDDVNYIFNRMFYEKTEEEKLFLRNQLNLLKHEK